MLLAAVFWSIAVIIFKSASKNLSPLLIVTLKNSIALLLFTISFLLFDIQIFYKGLTTNDYLKPSGFVFGTICILGISLVYN